METISLIAADGLAESDAVAIARRLTHSGSEFQIEILRVLNGEGSSATPIALWHSDGCLAAWACSHRWREMQTLEMFTDERFHGRGIASALSTFLMAAGILDRGQTLAVFSETTQRIAERMLFPDVRRFEWNGADWVRSQP
jgi:hypothetical protein